MLEIINFVKEYVVGFFVLISVLVFVHEYGHYIFAKMFGVKVESFSIGFGPEIFGWNDKSGTRWKLSPIPFGGYVKMKGEMYESASDNKEAEADSFLGKAIWKKFLIVFAGPLFNFIFPIFVLFFIYFFFGVSTPGAKIGEVFDGPAKGVLQADDMILEVDTVKITDFYDLQKIIVANPDKVLNIKLQRDGQISNVKLKVARKTENNSSTGYIAVSSSQSTLSKNKYDLRESLDKTYRVYNKVIIMIVSGLSQLLLGNVSMDDIGGPIKIAQLSGDSLKNGFDSWLFFLSILSLNLAIINLFPIPALDGGHLLLYIIQGITRRKINPKVQNILSQAGFVFLMLLMALVILKDIFSFM